MNGLPVGLYHSLARFAGATPRPRTCALGSRRRKQYNYELSPRATDLLWALELLNFKTVLDLAGRYISELNAGPGNEDRTSFAFV